MDPLSITASVAALLGVAKVAAKLTLTLLSFAEDAKLIEEDIETATLSFQMLANVMFGLRDSVEDLKNPRYWSRTIKNLMARDVFGQLTKASKGITRRALRQIDRLKDLQARSALTARFKWVTKEKAATKSLELAFKGLETPFSLVINLVGLEMTKLALEDPRTDPKEVARLTRENKRLTKSVHRYEELTKTLATHLVSATISTSQKTQNEVFQSIISVLPCIESVAPMTLGMTRSEIHQALRAQGPSSPSGEAMSQPELTTEFTNHNDNLRPSTASSGVVTVPTMSPPGSIQSVHDTNSDMEDHPAKSEDAGPSTATPPQDGKQPVISRSTPGPRRAVHVTPENFTTARQFHIMTSSQDPAASSAVAAVIDADLEVNLISIRRALDLGWPLLDLDEQDPTDLVYADGRHERILFKCTVFYSGLKRGRRGSQTKTAFFVCQYLQPEIIAGAQFTWLGSDDRDGRTYLNSGIDL